MFWEYVIISRAAFYIINGACLLMFSTTYSIRFYTRCVLTPKLKWFYITHLFSHFSSSEIKTCFTIDGVSLWLEAFFFPFLTFVGSLFSATVFFIQCCGLSDSSLSIFVTLVHSFELLYSISLHEDTVIYLSPILTIGIYSLSLIDTATTTICIHILLHRSF